MFVFCYLGPVIDIFISSLECSPSVMKMYEGKRLEIVHRIWNSQTEQILIRYQLFPSSVRCLLSVRKITGVYEMKYRKYMKMDVSLFSINSKVMRKKLSRFRKFVLQIRESWFPQAILFSSIRESFFSRNISIFKFAECNPAKKSL